MATLTVTTTYDTAQVLTEAQLDAIRTPIETHFNTAQVEGSNIQANILDGATYLADDAISAVKLASDSVTTAKLVDSTPSSDTGIITAKINDTAVTTAKLDDLAVTTAKIADANVTTDKIADDAVPKLVMLELPTASTNLSDLTVYRSLTSVSAFTSAGSENLIGSLTFSGLTSGKPVLINLQSSNTNSGYGYIEQVMYFIVNHAVTPPEVPYEVYVTQRVSCSLILKKDSTTVYTAEIGLGDIYNQKMYLRLPLSLFTYIDTASSTSHTYSLYIKCSSTVITDYSLGHGDITTGDEFDRVGNTVTAADNYIAVNSAKLVAIQLV